MKNAVGFTETESDSLCVLVETEAGKLYCFWFSPQSDEDFVGTASIMSASIQTYDESEAAATDSASSDSVSSEAAE